MMVQILIFMVILGALGWLGWRSWANVRRAREAAKAREEAFLRALASGQSGEPKLPFELPGDRPSLTPLQGAPAPINRGDSAGGGLAPYLVGAHAKAFGRLKATLPNHEIFPRASLRMVLGPHAVGKDLGLDFVICSPSLRPVAVVDLVTGEDLPPVVALKTERLAAAGLRYIRWDAEALPSVEEAAEGLGGRPGA